MSWSDLFRLIRPPNGSATERHVHGWRWTVVIAILLLLGNAAGGRGYLPMVPAFASAADVKVILELQYAEVIRGLQQQVCNATGQNRVTLEATLEDYQRRYRELTGRRYPPANCQ